MKVRVSEKVTTDIVKSWKDGDIITIKAGTGAGKSFFIKTHLYALAKLNKKKILMLVHRSDCKIQFKDEMVQVKRTDAIDIVTYQTLESLYKDNKQFNFSKYQYIVCDEFHYFMSDAAFNKMTDISLNAILGQTTKIRIFMSATGAHMTSYIKKRKKLETIDYELPIEYGHIKELTFFNKDESMEKFIEEAIEKKHKAIFFIQSAQKAYELYSKYKKYCLFNCSKYNKKYYKFVEDKKIRQMLQKERFEELILITTTCMDAGVNIRDMELKHIVCDVKDIGTLVQCIGRKRLEDNDNELYLYIKTITNKQLGGAKTQIKQKLEMANYLWEHGLSKYIEKYPREYDKWSIVYLEKAKGNETLADLKINDLMYYKSFTDEREIEVMLSHGNFGYCKSLARKFGFYDEYNGYGYRLIKEDNEKEELELYLESMVGNVLLKSSDRKELIEKINVKQDGKLLKSIDTLNATLREGDFNYYIKHFETSRIENGKKKNYKSAWKVLKLTEK